MRIRGRAAALAFCLALAPAVAGAQEHHRSTHSRSVWIDGSERVEMEIDVDGEIRFSDDDQAIRSLTPGGRVTVSERDRSGRTRRVQYRALPDGRLERSYWLEGRAAEFDAAAEAWVRGLLPRVVRETGIGAEARVARIHAREGVDGVLREVDRIGSDGVKRLYLQTLLRNHAVRPDEMPRLLRATARIGSDGDKAALLKGVAGRGELGRGDVRDAFFAAANSIGSDGDRAAVLGSVLARQQEPEVVAAVLRSAARIGSDGDKARVLEQASERGSLSSEEVRRAYFDAAGVIGSDGDRARVLSAVLRRHGAVPEVVLGVVRSARAIGSDGDKARVLLQVPRGLLQREPIATAFVEALKSIGSDGEYARVATFYLENRP